MKLFLEKSYLYLPLKRANAKTVEKFYKKISLTAGLPTDEIKLCLYLQCNGNSDKRGYPNLDVIFIIS